MRDTRVLRLFGSILVAAALTAAALQILSTTTAAALPYSASILAETQWLEWSRQHVRSFGMTEIDSEEWALMTMGSYITLTNGVDNGTTSLNTPIFVYEAFGDVPVLNGWGMASGSTDVGGFTVVFNGLNGQTMANSAYPQENLTTHGYGLDLSVIPKANVKPQTPMAPPTMIFMSTPLLEVTAEIAAEITE